MCTGLPGDLHSFSWTGELRTDTPIARAAGQLGKSKAQRLKEYGGLRRHSQEKIE